MSKAILDAYYLFLIQEKDRNTIQVYPDPDPDQNRFGSQFFTLFR